MKKVCRSILSVAICLFLLLELTSCGSNNSSKEKITINGESFSSDEFYNTLLNNEHKAKQYKGQEATVTGKISKIEENFNQTNLNHYFAACITIGYHWNFEVSLSALDDLEIGDTVTIIGKVSAILGSTLYCYDGNTILSKK